MHPSEAFFSSVVLLVEGASEELFYSFKMAVISNSSSGVLPQYGEIQNVGNEGGDFIFLKRK